MFFQLDIDSLKNVYRNAPKSRLEKYLPFLIEAMNEYEINTVLRAAAFIAQIGHESAELRYMEEIASGAAYEGRLDLGNVNVGDGKRYKGRGVIQLTGRANYRLYGKLLNLPLIDNPAMAKEPNVAFRLACMFWKVNKLNALADTKSFRHITRIINGGFNGLTDREAYYAKALNSFSRKDSYLDDNDSAIKLIVDGKVYSSYNESTPVYINSGISYTPVRALVEALGYTITDFSTQDERISLAITNTKTSQGLTILCRIVNNTAYASSIYLAQKLGLTVTFDKPSMSLIYKTI